MVAVRVTAVAAADADANSAIAGSIFISESLIEPQED